MCANESSECVASISCAVGSPDGPAFPTLIPAALAMSRRLIHSIHSVIRREQVPPAPLLTASGGRKSGLAEPRRPPFSEPAQGRASRLPAAPARAHSSPPAPHRPLLRPTLLGRTGCCLHRGPQPSHLRAFVDSAPCRAGRGDTCRATALPAPPSPEAQQGPP